MAACQLTTENANIVDSFDFTPLLHSKERAGSEKEQYMENHGFNIMSLQALLHEVDAIGRRRAAGHVGTIGMSGDVRNRVYHFDGDVRFKLIRNLLSTLRDLGD